MSEDNKLLLEYLLTLFVRVEKMSLPNIYICYACHDNLKIVKLLRHLAEAHGGGPLLVQASLYETNSYTWVCQACDGNLLLLIIVIQMNWCKCLAIYS